MEWARVTETDRMLSFVVGYAETGGSKGKRCKGLSKPNFGRGPNRFHRLTPDYAHELVIATHKKYLWGGSICR
jgi:hypothetical protein